MQSLKNDLIGKVLGTCLLERLIGQGGMSTVFLARQPQLSRYVAVKVLLPDVAPNSSLHQEFLARFRREAAAIAALDHVNIVPVYDYGEQEGIAYLVMPYLTEGSLRDEIMRRGVFSLQEALHCIDQAAAALDYAHTHGVIHRDLKPSNFLLHADGRLVLADFGIAHIMQGSNNASRATLTNTGALLGTPDYMSPEMIRGEQIDHRTDIYELGIVLFQMLSGDLPYKADTPLAILMRHLQDLLPPLHQLNLSIPLTVDAVIQKATAKNREDRYTSAGAFAQALHAAVAQPMYTFEVVDHTMPTIASSNIPAPARYSIAPTQLALNLEAQVPPRLKTPNLAPRRPRRYWPTLVLLCVLVLITSGILVGLLEAPLTGNTQPTIPTPSTSPAQKALATVQAFYTKLNAWDYPAAYKLLQSDNSPNGYCHFLNGYANTEHDEVTYGGVTQRDDGRFQAPITIVATEELPAGRVETTYTGYELVDPHSWLMIGGSLTKADRTPTPGTTSNAPLEPIQQAETVVKEFHAFINAHNYPEAYNLWGANLHNQTSYCSFVQGYSQTQHDDVRFDTTTQLSDGSVQMLATITASQQVGSETMRSIYHETYIVGQENGTWKILSGVLT